MNWGRGSSSANFDVSLGLAELVKLWGLLESIAKKRQSPIAVAVNPSTRLPPLRRVVLPRADVQMQSRRGRNTGLGDPILWLHCCFRCGVVCLLPAQMSIHVVGCRLRLKALLMTADTSH